MSEIRLWKQIVIGLIVAGAFFGLLGLRQILFPPPMNLLLISVDTLRADHLGCYGYSHPTSPNIDRLADQGILFERFISPRGLTHPAIATMLTGLETFHHKVRFNYHKPKGLTTLADVLREDRFLCRAYVSNADVFVDTGFDSESRGVTNQFLYNQTKRDQEITRLGVEFLKQRSPDSKQPFFLWLHYMSPHRPYTPPPPYDRGLRGKNKMDAGYYDKHLEYYMAAKADLSGGTLEEILDYYDGCVRFTDDLIGQVLEALQAGRLDKNTLVVFTADHGDELYDHYHYFLHQVSMFDGTLRIPLIFRFPKRMPEPIRVKEQVGLVNLMATLLDLLDVEYDGSGDGVSFLNLMETYQNHLPSETIQEIRQGWENRPIYIEMVRPEGNAYGVYQHPYKYIWVDYLEGETGFITQPIEQTDRLTALIAYPPELLFHLGNDPKESQNWVDQKPEIRDRLWGLIEDTLRENPGWDTVNVDVIDLERLQQLKAMGYLTGEINRKPTLPLSAPREDKS